MSGAAQAEPTAKIGAAKAERTFLGHPRGLAYIVFTEAWERFSFYGMQALLILYMATYLFRPEETHKVAGFAGFRGAVETLFGPLSVQALASQTFGLYVGLIYFMPVIGGLVGDRFLGRRRSVILGGISMAAGHIMMAFEGVFFVALAALIVGSGLLKGNLAAQVGNLYRKDDQRRDGGYALYVLSINVGAFLAPLVCGTLGELYGWHYGFGAAGIGMLVGLGIYVKGQRYLPSEEDLSRPETRPKLQKGDGKAIAATLGMLAVTALFWTSQSQVWNSYPLWVRARVDRAVGDFSVPITWFQSLDSLAVLVLAPAVLWHWRRLRQRAAEPSDLTKIAIGCVVFAAACAWLAAGEVVSEGGAVALYWPTVFHFICAVGFLYVGPIALALTSRAAPAAVNAMMVSSYYLAIFAGGIASGWLGRFYEVVAPASFWLIHAAVVGAGALLIVLLRPVLIGAMKLDEQPHAQTAASNGGAARMTGATDAG